MADTSIIAAVAASVIEKLADAANNTIAHGTRLKIRLVLEWLHGFRT